jgi:uncharacterized damage-inducible protein DinB
MDLLDRLIEHDSWTTGYLLDRMKSLSDDQLDQQFDLGHGTLRSTVEHIVRNVEGWTDLMNECEIRSRPRDDLSLAALRRRYDAAVLDFGNTARRLRDDQKINDTYMDVLDSPPRAKSFGGTILHVLTHNHSHRTEMLHMLERLGVKDLIEGDVLSWEEAHAHLSKDI